MTEVHNELGNSIIISPTLLVTLLVSAVGLGGGSYGLVVPQLETKALSSCIDQSGVAINQSKIAIDIAAQHGDELSRLNNFMLEKTQYRYTSEDAAQDHRKQSERDNLQDQRIRNLERHVDESR